MTAADTTRVEFCGAQSEAPDGTGLVCVLPKGHPPARTEFPGATHQGWYEGSRCLFDVDAAPET